MDERRFEVKCRLTAEEVVLFDRVREQNGLTTSALVRMYIKEGMAKDCIEHTAKAVAAAPHWDRNVRPFRYGGWRKGTQ